MSTPQPPAVRLFVGGHTHSIAGEPVQIDGDRCFTPIYAPPKHADPSRMTILLDSAAFSDVLADARLTCEAALCRQLEWERRATRAWGEPVTAYAVVAYDRLIDEMHVNGRRRKQRWTVAQAESAVAETVAAAAYLASQRTALHPRRVVLCCQGVSAEQYVGCVQQVLSYARPGDWIGFGGWCWVGRHQTWLPEFQRTVAQSLPLIVAAGVRQVHLFGVLWEPAVASLLWEADRHGISVSVDSTAPVLAATRGNARKAGMRGDSWKGNVDWWRVHLSSLRSSRYYREPYLTRQLPLLEVA